jgi:hypothetical protein
MPTSVGRHAAVATSAHLIGLDEYAWTVLRRAERDLAWARTRPGTDDIIGTGNEIFGMRAYRRDTSERTVR